MSFICVICRDLLKIIEEEASPRHQQQLQLIPLLSNNQSTANSHHNVSSTTSANNGCLSGRRKGKNNSIVATKCGHLFHYSCLSIWLKQVTSDSKMRCPSCKQLIYIYELIQLFPVENGGGYNKDLEELFSTAFQQKLKSTLGQLENLCRDLGKKQNEILSSSPLKGNETPTRLQRVRDSPKRSHISQVAQLMKEMDSLRGSIKDLNSFIEQHAELGSVVENQTRQISELRSKNDQLLLANERLKSTEIEKEDATTTTVLLLASHNKAEGSGQKNEDVSTNEIVHGEAEEILERTAQEQEDKSPELFSKGNLQSDPTISKESGPVDSTSPSANNPRRKSVTFLDPFDEFNGIASAAMTTKNRTIPFETKDLRVGDKVMWIFEGHPEVGTVKWKGFIGSQINVGVEFERQLGLPIKDLSSDALQCIFKFKPGHGRLIPVQEVIPCDREASINCSPSSANSHYITAEQYTGGKASTNGINRRIQLCTHQ